MVVLLIVDPNRASVLEHRAVLRHSVRNPREEFRQVERRIRVMTYPDKKHLPVQIVQPTDRAFGDVGRNGKRVGGDPDSFRPERRERMEVIASPYIGQSPESIRNDSEAWRRWTGKWVEGSFVILRPRRHCQGAVGAEDVMESLDQAERSSIDWSCAPEGGVYEQDTAFLDSEGTELIGYLSSAQPSCTFQRTSNGSLNKTGP
jgi:hypothetical protein